MTMQSYPRADMKAPFDALANQIKTLSDGRKVVFFVNHGNWGDALIREGAEAFFKFYDIDYFKITGRQMIRNQIDFDEIRAQTGQQDPLMVYNGCGAFFPEFNRLPEVAALAQNFTKAILMPATFGVSADGLTFADKTSFFVRDHSVSTQNCPDPTFCHDMAFCYTPPKFPQPNRAWGLFLRGDVEKPADLVMPEGYGNNDLSARGRADDPIYNFMKELAKFEKIYTNRLHVGIAGALLGREVHLYSNHYFKIQSIYEASLRDYYPNVHFHKNFDIQETGITKPGTLARLFPSLRN